ncbi:MAG TPA: roadblock/LC7 domain-containing protein [Gaiellaceae bacterium]|nr:roadblock/LC7 domain-containing protein [Gaiellaceae bacterium]
MDAAAALARLREISSQVRSAVIFERGGKVIGSTFADEQRAKDVAGEAEALLTEAEGQRGAADGPAEFAQLEVALHGGSVFVVRDGDRLIAATTQPEPTVGLVFYDLKSSLRDLDTAPTPKKRAAPARRKPPTGAKKTDAKP